jgi:hypothetical protein
MASIVQFVDSISANPMVRLDLNSRLSGLMVKPASIDLSPPPLKQSWASTLLAPGARPTAANHENRTVKLPIALVGQPNSDTAATVLQRLARELDRSSNLLMMKLDGMSSPVFFRTFRDTYTLSMLRLLLTAKTGIVLELPAEPYGIGLPQTAVNAVTVYADPAHPAAPLNPNANFNSNVTGWSPTGGTFVQSSAQAHEGSGSGLFTPDAVTVTTKVELSTHFTAVAGQIYRGHAWIRCDVARSISLNVDFYTAADVYISSVTRTIAVAATTWTEFDAADIAPAGTGKVGLSQTMTGTPPASNKFYTDEAWVALVGDGGANGCHVDIPAGTIIGDVETPADIMIDAPHILDATVKPKSVFAMRRHGTPAQAPFLLQAETMTGSNGTAIGAANDANFSGGGPNYMRVTPSNTNNLLRLAKTGFPIATPNSNYRGTYKLLARVRQNTGGDTYKVQSVYGYGSYTITNDQVQVPQITASQYVELGLVTFPIGPDPVYDMTGVELPVDNSGVFLQLFVQRSAGTGTLDVDHLLLVPADDTYGLVDWPDETTSAPTIHYDGIAESAWAETSGAFMSLSPSAGPYGGFMLLSPQAAQRLVFVPVVNQASGETISYSYTVTIRYLPRYLFVAPAAT